MQHVPNLIPRAKKDLQSIVKGLNNARQFQQSNFSEDLNSYLNEMTEEDKKNETQAVITIHSYEKIEAIKPGISWLSWAYQLFGGKNRENVRITVLMDFYWLVKGQKSSTPAEIDKKDIQFGKKVQFLLEYKEEERGMLLTFISDDSGVLM